MLKKLKARLIAGEDIDMNTHDPDINAGTFSFYLFYIYLHFVFILFCIFLCYWFILTFIRQVSSRVIIESPINPSSPKALTLPSLPPSVCIPHLTHSHTTHIPHYHTRTFTFFITQLTQLIISSFFSSPHLTWTIRCQGRREDRQVHWGLQAASPAHSSCCKIGKGGTEGDERRGRERKNKSNINAVVPTDAQNLAICWSQHDESWKHFYVLSSSTPSTRLPHPPFSPTDNSITVVGHPLFSEAFQLNISTWWCKSYKTTNVSSRVKLKRLLLHSMPFYPVIPPSALTSLSPLISPLSLPPPPPSSS